MAPEFSELVSALRSLLPPELQRRFDEADKPGVDRLSNELEARVRAGWAEHDLLADLAGRVRTSTKKPVALLLWQLKQRPMGAPAKSTVANRRPAQSGAGYGSGTESNSRRGGRDGLLEHLHLAGAAGS